MVRFPGIGFRLFSTKTDKELLALCNFVDLPFCRTTNNIFFEGKKLSCVDKGMGALLGGELGDCWFCFGKLVLLFRWLVKWHIGKIISGKF